VELMSPGLCLAAGGGGGRQGVGFACAEFSPSSSSAPKKKMGKRPGELSATLKEKLESSSNGDMQPGIRVQLARSMSTVFAPSGYVNIEGSGAVPDASLELEYVYGYNGSACRDYVFLNADGEVVYPIAALGVVYDTANKTQKHFKGHSEDITCVAMHPDRRYIATGQLDPKGAETPFVCIWDSCDADMKQVARVDFHERAVTAVAFSADGTKLVSIGEDDDHWMAVWEWEHVLAKGGSSSEPACQIGSGKEQVFGVSAVESAEKLVTYGPRHVKFWGMKEGALTSKLGKFGLKDPAPKAILCAAFPGDGAIAVGGDNGNVYFFDWEGVLQKKVLAHEGAVSAILCSDGVIRTGGFDGKIKMWSAEFDSQGEIELCTNETVVAGAAMGQDMKGVRGTVKSMDFVGGQAVVGTKDSEVYLVDVGSKQVQCVTQGHSGELWGLVTHPTQAVCVTAGDDKVLRCWDMCGRSAIAGKVLGLPYMARSLGMSPDGKHIAVGFKEGSGGGGSAAIWIVEFETL